MQACQAITLAYVVYLGADLARCNPIWQARRRWQGPGGLPRTPMTPAAAPPQASRRQRRRRRRCGSRSQGGNRLPITPAHRPMCLWESHGPTDGPLAPMALRCASVPIRSVAVADSKRRFGAGRVVRWRWRGAAPWRWRVAVGLADGPVGCGPLPGLATLPAPRARD